VVSNTISSIAVRGKRYLRSITLLLPIPQRRRKEESSEEKLEKPVTAQ